MASPPGRLLGRLGSATRWAFTKRVATPLPIVLGGAAGTWFALQNRLGTGEDIFDGVFITDKDPAAVSEFYQAEDLLRIIAIHPILFNLFMNKVDPDTETATEETALLSTEETHFHVRLLGMEVSFEIIEREEEDPENEDESVLVSFNRHERFIDWVPILNDFGIKVMLWDQIWSYRFERKEDGKLEVRHHCEFFSGPWPIRVIVYLHQAYVLWACDKFINGSAFGDEDTLDEQQEQLANIPLHVFQDFVGTLRSEKTKSLEDLKNQPHQDAEAIAKAEESIKQLDKLAEKDMSTISVVRRQGPSGASAARGNKPQFKLVVGDAETEAALNSARTDAKASRTIASAVQTLTTNADLEFEDRAAPRSAIRKSAIRKTPPAPKIPTPPPAEAQDDDEDDDDDDLPNAPEESAIRKPVAAPQISTPPPAEAHDDDDDDDDDLPNAPELSAIRKPTAAPEMSTPPPAEAHDDDYDDDDDDDDLPSAPQETVIRRTPAALKKSTSRPAEVQDDDDDVDGHDDDDLPRAPEETAIRKTLVAPKKSTPRPTAPEEEEE